METPENRIFAVKESDFEALALEVFRFQYDNCPVYHDFVKVLGRPEPRTLEEIPFLPISFFKTHDVVYRNTRPALLFLSSGTTGQERSRHLIYRPDLYERSFLSTYEAFSGNIKEQVILALLPNYLEQGNSSLVYMVDHLIRATENDLSGFFRDEHEKLLSHYEKALKLGKKVVILGVSYALLDLAEKRPDLSRAAIIETGGMKGRRRELNKKELHGILREAFSCEFISSEYGMTELLSQAYSDKDGYFALPPWMRILIRDTNDPFSYPAAGKTGGINVIDLANLYSCSFISTQDLGQLTGKGLKLMGRFDQADIRGCNLLVE